MRVWYSHLWAMQHGLFLAASNEGEVMEVISMKDAEQNEKEEALFDAFAGPAVSSPPQANEEQADLCQSIPLSRQKAMRPENRDDTFDSDIPPSPGRLDVELPPGRSAQASSSSQPTRTSKRKTKRREGGEKTAPTLDLPETLPEGL